MRDRVPALREDVGAHSRLIIEQGTFVWVGGGRVHARTEVDEDAVVSVSALDDDGGGIGTETRRVHEVFGGKNADLGGPLERRSIKHSRRAGRSGQARRRDPQMSARCGWLRIAPTRLPTSS